MGLLRHNSAPADEKNSDAVDRLVICSLCGLSYSTSQANSIAKRQLLIGSLCGAVTVPAGFAVFDPMEVRTAMAVVFACFIGGVFGAFAAMWDWHALGHVLRMGFRAENDRLAFDKVEFAAIFREGPTSAWIVVFSIALLYGAHAWLGWAGIVIVLIPVIGACTTLANSSTKRTIGTVLAILGIGVVVTLLPQTLRFVFQEGASLEIGAQLMMGVAAMMIVGGSLLRRRGTDR